MLAAETTGVLLRRLLGTQVRLDFGPPIAGSAFEYVRVMDQSIKQRRDGVGVAERFAPSRSEMRPREKR
jgi:hypothetical protein